ncbi:MAG: cell division protein FtsA [Oligoflexales bacterium]|nr:cell division protein FtsA [Oligoflexales bacterium]
MAKPSLFALDLGTTKFCLASISKNVDKPSLDTVSIPAQGMRRGMLSDFQEVQKSLTSLLELAERKFDDDIHKAVVGISGSHLRGQIVSLKIPIEESNPIIESFILSKAQETLLKKNDAKLREIIHIIPLNYQIDDREWIINPVGFSGSSLTARYFVIDADKNYVSDLIRLCNQCGIEVAKLIAEPYASAAVSIDDVKKNVGVAIADIGGGTTDGIIFKNGQPVRTFTINIGGQMITNDLSIGMGISFDEAERIKIISGLKKEEDIPCIQVKDVHGKMKSIARDLTHDILRFRTIELGELILKETLLAQTYLSAGIILTGGGSEIAGLPEFLSQHLKIQVEKANPQIPFHNISHQHKMTDPNLSSSSPTLASKYATVAGLLYLGLLHNHGQSPYHSTVGITKYFQRFVSWIRELT